MEWNADRPSSVFQVATLEGWSGLTYNGMEWIGMEWNGMGMEWNDVLIRTVVVFHRSSRSRAGRGSCTRRPTRRAAGARRFTSRCSSGSCDIQSQE